MIKTCENCRFYGGNCPYKHKCVRTTSDSTPSCWMEMTEAQKIERMVMQSPGKKLMGDITTGYVRVDPMKLSINVNELHPTIEMEVKNMKNNTIKKVIFNDPATIVIWSDDTKTIVKAENEPFDPEKGLAMAIAKHSLGNRGNYYEVFKKWLPEEEEKIEEPVKEKYMSVKEFANMAGVSKSTIIKQIHKGQIFGAKKDSTGKWAIPVGGLYD